MLGLVLEGGGAKGSYHAGAYKALAENNLIPDAVVGTSIGALNGALIAQGDWEKMVELWSEMSISKILDIDQKHIHSLQKKQFSWESFQYFATYLHRSLEEDGLDTSKIRKLLESIIDEDKLRNSSIDFGLVTVSISELKPYEVFKDDIPKGQLIDYLMASSNFPIFKRQVIDGKKFIDGGVYDNTPIDLLKNKGFDHIIVIRTHGLGINRSVDMKNVKITTIDSKDDLGGLLEFSKENCLQNLQLGYYDALKAIRPLHGRDYYFQPLNNEPYIIEKLLKMPESIVNEIAMKIGVNKEYSHARKVLEGIVPALADLVDAPKSASYEEILEFVCEEAAKKIPLNRFKIYTLTEMIEHIQSQYKPVSETLLQKWFALPMKNDLFRKAFKDQIINEVIMKVFQIQKDPPQ
ncbi:MAG: patatin-like phospholipase family protein [Caldisericia bacterium]|nr:patatin-like phospholipase family protein [Caldisericia bacterium]MDD4613953.1 patatin-like phospholipase family protein [Caldisericia bacterium]